MRKILALACATLIAASPVMAASVTPLVLKNGQQQQLQSGDTAKFPNAAGGGANNCAQFDNSGNLSGIGSPCGTTSGTVTTTGSPASGNLTKFSGSTSITNGDLTGDTTTSGTLATTTGKINGTSVPASPSAHQVLIVTGANTGTWKTVPDCTDTGGNHLNYTQSTDTVSCGTSSSGGGGGSSILVNAQTGTSYTLNATDAGKMVTFSNASAVAVTVPQATGSFTSGYWAYLCNVGVSLVTATPTTSTIGGKTSIILEPKGGCDKIISDGTNYQEVPTNGFYTGSGGASPSYSLTQPDGTTTGGNQRGGYAVDLQLTRGANTQVPSGSYTFAAGRSNTVSNTACAALGESNTASGGDCFAAGSGNTASGQYSSATGVNNTCSGYSSFCGGNGNTASANYSTSIGESNTTGSSAATGSVQLGTFASAETDIGRFTFNSGNYYSSTTNETAHFVCTLGSAVSNASAARLTADGSAANTHNICNISAGAAMTYTVQCTITDYTTNNGKIDTFSFGQSLAWRDTNITLSSGNPAVTVGPTGASSMTMQANPTITADTSNQGFNISYTPPTGNTDTLQAVCTIQGTESLE